MKEKDIVTTKSALGEEHTTEANDLMQEFSEVVRLIREARKEAINRVNAELINCYWQVGEYISKKVEKAEWGKGIVDNLAEYIYHKLPGIRGFNRRGLYRMKQFYETYKDHNKVSTLLTQISWSSHLHILSKTKTMEEKEFYLRLAMKERYSVRELERQIDSCFYERTLLSKMNVSTPVTQNQANVSSEILATFKDNYVLDFLNLPEPFSEDDLRKGIVRNLKGFILEAGKDFCFIGEEYRLQVGSSDFFIDLLFFHRSLSCLVAFELKITDFKPEYIGKMGLYLEALDRDVKNFHENPSVGIILCKSKDAEIVEYTMSRNLSPSLVAEYETKLPDRELLRKKLHEIFRLSESTVSCEDEDA